MRQRHNGSSDSRRSERGRWGAVAANADSRATQRKLTLRPGTPPPRRIRLDVVVQQLHWVQLRAIAGQKVQLDLVGVASDPGADKLGPVHWMAVHDQVDLPPAEIAQQPTQEVDEDPAAERPGKEAEPQPPGVGDGADHVDPEALAGSLDDRGLAHRRPGAARRRI